METAGPGRGDRGRPLGLLGPPSAKATRLYRVLLAVGRMIGAVLGIRLRLEGAERLPRTADGRPAGGWIAVGVPHRTWVDPFVLALLLPVEPRLVWLGDGRAIFRSPLRRLVFRRIGGVIPIWPGGGRDAVDAHFAGAQAALRAGAVFALFPEVGPAVAVDRAREFGAGVGYVALRTGVSVVPLILGGAHELYLGRRIVLRVLPPVAARELAGLGPGDAVPAPGSREEREAAHRVVAALHALTAAAVTATHIEAEPRPGARKRWRGLTHLFH
ncbi:MAG: lysophospholipid acyltransferase family protein [Chloroflexota bacterium]